MPPLKKSQTGVSLEHARGLEVVEIGGTGLFVYNFNFHYFCTFVFLLNLHFHPLSHLVSIWTRVHFQVYQALYQMILFYIIHQNNRGGNPVGLMYSELPTSGVPAK